MKTFKTFIKDQNKPFQVQIAEMVVDRVLKKYRLKEHTAVTFTDKIEIFFNKPCSDKMAQKIQTDLNNAGLSAIYKGN